MKRDKFIALRLTKQEYMAVNEIANVKGCGVSQLIREALDFYLNGSD